MATRGLIFLTLCLWACSFPTASITAQGRRRGRVPQTGLTLEYIYGRMRTLERKLSRTQQEVTNVQTQVKSLEDKFSTGGGGGGTVGDGTGAAPAGRKLSDLSACPIRAPDFYYAPQFKSCYHMEPSDVLVNQTEAIRMCKTLSARSDLVSIETEEEQEFLKMRWQAERGVGSLVRFWTSARRNAGKWRWEGSDAEMTNTNWIPTTEHNDDRFSCMGVYSNEAFTWIDVACWAPHLITCEVNI